MGPIAAFFRGFDRQVRTRPPVRVGLLTAGYLVTAFLDLKIIVYPSHAPAFWMATSFLVCLVLMSRGALRGTAVAVCLAGTLIVARWAHWPWLTALLLTTFTAVEAALAAWLSRRISGVARIGSLKEAARVIALVICPTAVVSSLMAGAACQLLYGRGFGMLAFEWFCGHFAGMLMALPTLLLLASPTRSAAPRKHWLERLLLGVALIVFAVSPWSATLSTFTYILILPAATVFAFRLGLKTTVVSILVNSVISQVYYYLHPNPAIWGVPLSMAAVILIGQIYYLAVYLNGLFTGQAIDYQSRLKQLFERKSEAARQARAKAMSASRAKTEFLATMSHEIRTPLNGVIGFTQVLLRSEALVDRDRQQLDLISASGQALLTIVNDILDFSKVEAGQVALNPRPTRLAALVQEAIAIVQPEATRKELDLRFECETSADAVHLVDDQRLKQVLINLLNNAVKFTAVGGVTTTLSQRGETLRFEVRDTGPGIAPDALPRLFRRFSQANSSISRSHGGTGLGLAICKGLVELMGGRIGVSSIPGQGASFWFEISPPLTDAVRPQARRAQTDGAIAAHVLLVDDHAINRQLGVTVLSLLGCTVDTAENGLLAVEAVRTGDYDLVLMDVHMPLMDGLDATRAIRALDHPSHNLPVVSMSADVLPDRLARCMAAGMNDRVTKPIEIEELQACLIRWTGRDSSGRLRAA